MTKEGYTHIIVPQSLHNQLKTLAQQNNTSISQLINQLINISINVSLNIGINTGINTTQLNQQYLSLTQAPNQQNSPKQATLIEKEGIGNPVSDLARGAGFEPARPLLTTGLAGLPPTRLGQPRNDTLNRFLYFQISGH